jgi:hypothetical protein
MQRAFALLGPERDRLFSEIRRYPAVDGSNPAMKAYLTSRPFWEKTKMLPAGAVAVFASHVRIWEEWARTPTVDGGSSNQWLMIMEDDVSLAPTFARDTACWLELFSAGAMDKVYHGVWPGFHLHVTDRWLTVAQNEPMKIVPLKQNAISQGIGGMFCYMLSKEGARIATEMVKIGHNHKKGDPVDVWFMRCLHDKMNHLAPTKPSALSDFYIPGQPYDGDISLSKPIIP